MIAQLRGLRLSGPAYLSATATAARPGPAAAATPRARPLRLRRKKLENVQHKKRCVWLT